MGTVLEPHNNYRKRLFSKIKFAVRNPGVAASLVRRKLRPIVATDSALANGSPIGSVAAHNEFSFAAFIRETLDGREYLKRHPDVQAANLDPLSHWLEHGVFEGRWFAPRMSAVIGERADGLTGPIFREFEWRGMRVAVMSTRTADLDAPDDIAFINYVEANFNAAAYLSHYPDVRASGADPLEHWLEYGLYEGRFFAPGMVAKLDAPAAQVAGHRWVKFKWLGRSVAFRSRKMRGSLLRQIEEQARHDGAVFAPGHLAIPFLPEFDALDLVSRDGVDVRSIFQAIADRPDMIVLTPFLCVGGAEKYSADLVRGFAEIGRGRTLVVVTDQDEKAAEGWRELGILKPFAQEQVIFWRDICGPNYHGHVVLARFINALRPKYLLVNNSRIGLDAVSTFGRGLSHNTKIFCTFFSAGVAGLGAPHGVRFPLRTLPFSAALTDNQPMADILTRQWGGLSAHGVVKLAPRVDVVSEESFLKRLDERLVHRNKGGRPRRWVWVSRVESFKGTEVLASLAELCREDEFHIFGPVQEQLDALGLDKPNVHYQGVLASVPASDFATFDGFVFTSLFEGMPNVVLEMSQHAIPLVLANVGGLKNTFDSKSAIFNDHHENPLETAHRFAAALKKISEMPEQETIAMVTSAYEQVRDSHGPDAYTQNVKKLFEGEKRCV